MKDTHKGVTCDKCEIWHHIECVNISDEQYKSLFAGFDYATPVFHWYCRFCKPRCIEAVAKIDLLESQTRNLATNMAKLTERVGKLENNIKKEVISNVRTQIDEKVDIDKRKMNLIVHNLPEPVKPSISKGVDNAWYTDDKKAADTRAFVKLLEQSLDIDSSVENDIVDIIRLGKESDSGKARLLRVTLSNIKLKREILGKAKLLRFGRNRNVFINPDLTPDQRKADYNLRVELKERKGNGEANIKIVRGSIVTTISANRHVQEDDRDDSSTYYSDIVSEDESDMPTLDEPFKDSDVDDNTNKEVGNNEVQTAVIVESELDILEISSVTIVNDSQNTPSANINDNSDAQNIKDNAQSGLVMNENGQTASEENLDTPSAINEKSNAQLITENIQNIGDTVLVDNENETQDTPSAIKEKSNAQLNTENNQNVGDVTSENVITTPSASNDKSNAHIHEESTQNQMGGDTNKRTTRQRKQNGKQ